MIEYFTFPILCFLALPICLLIQCRVLYALPYNQEDALRKATSDWSVLQTCFLIWLIFVPLWSERIFQLSCNLRVTMLILLMFGYVWAVVAKLMCLQRLALPRKSFWAYALCELIYPVALILLTITLPSNWNSLWEASQKAL